MKNYIGLLAILILIACASTRGRSNKDKRTDLYEVYKIDSINTYYLIYAKRRDTLYKIVSLKGVQPNCSTIQIRGAYDFKLRSYLKDLRIGNTPVEPTLHVSCFGFANSTMICLERDSINDLHFVDNVKGLCFIK